MLVQSKSVGLSSDIQAMLQMTKNTSRPVDTPTGLLVLQERFLAEGC